MFWALEHKVGDYFGADLSSSIAPSKLLISFVREAVGESFMSSEAESQDDDDEEGWGCPYKG